MLGAFTDGLDRRFQSFTQSEQAKLIESMRWEDKMLTQYMEKNRLAEWVRTTFDAAQVEVRNLVDAATMAGASAAAAREPFQPVRRRSSAAADVGDSLLMDADD